MGQYCTPACIPCRISCVSQAQFKEILGPLLFPATSVLPTAVEAACECNWAAAVGQFSIQQSLAAFSGGAHSVGSDLLCYNTESRAVRFDLDKGAVLWPIPTIQGQIEGQHLFTLH